MRWPISMRAPRPEVVPVANVLGVPIDAVGLEASVERILAWAQRGESRCVCACNVHTVVSARLDPEFAAVIGGADLRVADGAPVAWHLRRQGFAGQQRVAGPDLMWRCCERAAAAGLPVFLYGSSVATLERLRERLSGEFPALRIAGTLAPPFRALSPPEDAQVVAQIAASGARLVFVALGCPKQEAWMAAHRPALRAVMLGVGAAFDFHARTAKRAPRWMRDAGLEWLYRLAHEPRRLWRRYLVSNTLFLAWTLAERLERPAARRQP